MLEKLSKYKLFAINEGFVEAFRRFNNAIVRIFYDNRILLVYEKCLRLNSPNTLSQRNQHGLIIHEASAKNIPELANITYQTRAELMERFSKGKRCIVALANGEIGSYLWLTTKREYLPDIKSDFTTPSNTIYLFNVRTRKQFRRQGIALSLLSKTCDLLYEEGFDSIYVTILADNFASQNAFEKAEFRRIGHVNFRNILGRRKYSISPDVLIFFRTLNDPQIKN